MSLYELFVDVWCFISGLTIMSLGLVGLIHNNIWSIVLLLFGIVMCTFIIINYFYKGKEVKEK